MKSVLVSGATGFIGRQCVVELLQRDFEVHGVFASSKPSEISGVHWHQADMMDSRQFSALLEAVAPTHLLHLAWTATPRVYMTSLENLAWLRAGVELIDTFQQLGGQRFVGAGTCFEYDWSYGYCRERLTPMAPSTLYGTCKHALQLTLTKMCEQVDLSGAWGRVFFLYGPHEHPDRLVSSVIRALLRGEEAPCSAGTQIRDFLHVRDVAKALVALLESDLRGPVNIGSGQPVAVKTVIETIGMQLGRSELVRLGALPTRANEPPLILADVERLREEAKFVPDFSLETGIADAINWWRHSLEA